MNPTRLSDVRRTLASLDVRPRKSLGQNFLIDRNVLEILLKAADLAPTDGVLEIGPGLGVLTGELARRVRRVVAVEKDARLFGFLAEAFPAGSPVSVLYGDALAMDLDALMRSGIDKVVASLPFASGSRILLDLAGGDVPPRHITVTVQQEVAERMAAAPGSRDYGILSVWTQVRYDVRIVRSIRPTCFWPRPEVKAAIVTLRRHGRHPMEAAETAFFRALSRECFLQRRKQVAGILARSPRFRVPDRNDGQRLIRDAGGDPRARAEQLGVPVWRRLTRRLQDGQSD
jgi:16S rRNA (adenine1518-N6/adenine1519-N6)-dimethyltransferase